MNKIEIKYAGEGRPISEAPAGSICKIIEASDAWMVGCLCVVPFCNNQAVVILNRNVASSSRHLGITKVAPLNKGDIFTVTIS